MRKFSGGTVSNLKMHLVLVTKYRRKVISHSVLKRLEEVIAATCQKWDCELLECNGENNHVQLLIEYTPQMQISKFVNNLKTVSSRLIRKEFPEVAGAFHKDVFWKIGYYVGSCGGASLEKIKAYIEQQDSPV